MSDEQIPGEGWENIPQDLKEASEKVMEILEEDGFDITNIYPVPNDDGIDIPININPEIRQKDMELMEKIHDEVLTDDMNIVVNGNTQNIEIRRRRIN